MRLCLAHLLLASSLVASCGAPVAEAPADPLPSWNDGAARKAILDFVAKTTRQGDADFVPPPERVAVFDNDCTLWSEQPMYFQLAFALDRIKVLAPTHPEWKTTQPFKGVLEGDLKSVLASGPGALMQLVAVTHTGITTEEFQSIVTEWIAA